MAGNIEQLVDELERSYQEAQERMSDPAVYNDHREAAALWAGDLYRALTRYAERRGFTVEQLGASPNESGGFKEVTFAVKGDGAFSVFKWEGGTHRVQRVPET